MPIYKLGTRTPDTASSSWVAPSAEIIGDVVLKGEVSIWFNAVLRGDNERIEIKCGSNIQDNCTLHTDTRYPLVVGEETTVGHNVILHGCVIGPASLIGMGSVLLNGVRVGKNCLIGANTLLTEGKVIPDQSLVFGTPGKVVRTLTDEEIQSLRDSAQVYQKKAHTYKNILEPVTRL